MPVTVSMQTPERAAMLLALHRYVQSC